MKAKPLIVGALLLAPMVGAVAGQNMNTDPISSVTDLSATLPGRPVIASTDAAPRTTPRLPDHYAMETPEGRVEVHELAMRGRYADRYEPYQTWRPDVEENLAMLEARYDSDALDARAARALAPQDMKQATPAEYQPREVANYSRLENARIGEVQQAGNVTAQPEITGSEPQIANMRVINVKRELALQY